MKSTRARSLTHSFFRGVAAVSIVSFFLFPGGIASASTLVSGGALAGDTTWALAGSPYVVSTDVSIPAGAALLVEPGVVVKFTQAFATLNVEGALSARGTQEAPIVFTSIKDDTAGGDTNNDGSATFPSSLSWRGIIFYASSSAHMTHTSIRYGGQFLFTGSVYQSFPMVRNMGGALLLDHAELQPNTFVVDAFEQASGSTTIMNTKIGNARNGILVSGGTLSVHDSSIASVINYALNNTTANVIDATSNWWGDASGPFHVNNLDGGGARIFGSVSSSPWLSRDPFSPFVAITPSSDAGFSADHDNPSINPNSGAINTDFTFKVVYINSSNQAPSDVRLLVAGDNPDTPCQVSTGGGVPFLVKLFVHTAYAEGLLGCVMQVDQSAAVTLRDGNYANGEQYIFTQQFPAGNYTYHFESDNTLYPDGDEFVFTVGDTLVPCTTDCYSNVLFLPGLEASRLYTYDDPGCMLINCENQLWEPNRNDDVRKLYLDYSGKSTAPSDIYTRDVIDEVNILPFGQGNIYKSFLNDLDAWKNTDRLITDYSVTPYDWRLSLDDIISGGKIIPKGISYTQATSSPYIIQELQRLAKSSKTGKVTIVAHSNGGLVAKALTQKLGGIEASKLIDKIIFVAVPQEGTPDAIGALLHGFKQNHFPVLDTVTARTLAENMPSAYGLLPSEKYFNNVQTPVIVFDNSPLLSAASLRYHGGIINTSAELYDFLLGKEGRIKPAEHDINTPNVLNELLLDSAETVKQSLDSWAPPVGIDVAQVAGWGEDTLATIEYYEGKKTYCSDPQDIHTCTDVPAVMYKPLEVVDGDGTVVIPSALGMNAMVATKYWVNLREYDTYFNYKREHADILEVPELRALVQNILTKSTSMLPRYIYSAQPLTLLSDKRLRFILHSPLNLSATDNLSNTVSSAGSAIPGSRWKRYGEVQVLTVPKGTPITLHLDGYATGSFTLDMEEIDGDNTVTASSTLSAVPSATSTKATMAFVGGTLQNASPLLLDYDGNGATDFTIRPTVGKTTVFDVTPPEARISFSTTTRKLLIEGINETSGTTVLTTSTSTAITDEAGNTLEIIFSKFKQEKNKLKLELQTLIQNGVSTSATTKTTLQYEWSTDKLGNIKELEQKATVGTVKIEAHYDAKKNVTRIERKWKNNEKETKEVLLGLKVLNLVTDKGRVSVDY